MASPDTLLTLEDMKKKKRVEDGLNDNLKIALEDIAGMASEPTVEFQEEEQDTVLQTFEEMKDDQEAIVEPDPNKLVEQSIFDLVVDMERQFDDIFDDVEAIKKDIKKKNDDKS